MNTVILYRNDINWKAESEIAQKYFPAVVSRCQCKKGDLVIPRFSGVPFYKELEFDLSVLGAKLINSYNQHQYIADLGNWYYDLAEFTPDTYTDLHHIPENIPVVLKGETNSKKFFWNEMMFAKNKKEAIEVYGRLIRDSELQYQKIYIRKYIELEKLCDGLSGLPITREYRFFIYKDTVLSGGFYWSCHVEDLLDAGVYINPDEVPMDFLNKIISKIRNTEICEPPDFFVLDVAKTKSGEWILVEVNDSSMSGLSENDPDIMYSNLKKELEKACSL